MIAMNSDIPVRKRQRVKADRNDPNFHGFGCYVSDCEFVSTGKNGLSAHLRVTHGLKQSEKELDKIVLIKNPSDGHRNLPISANARLRVASNELRPSTLTEASSKPLARELSAPQLQCLFDNPVAFLDRLPPWKDPSSSSQLMPIDTTTHTPKILSSYSSAAVAELPHMIFAPASSLPPAPSTTVVSPAHKIAIPVSRVRSKFDHTRLPVFYKCYIPGCNVLGRTPESILKHWKADENPFSDGNSTHVGHAWEIEKVYKFIRFQDGEVHATTHSREPNLPTTEMLNPKNVKQYLPPLEHTNIASFKIRSTDNMAIFLDTETWFCNLCYAPIGNLHAVKEHLVDAHFLKKLDHNAQTKMIHFLAAYVNANGKSECYTPEHDGKECDYVGNGDILEHLTDQVGHGLDEDDLLPNEQRGNIFLTVAEVKTE